MKKLLVVLVSLLLVVLFTNVAFAAEQTVTVNPFGLMFGIINGQYEKPLGNQDSLLVSGSFYSFKVLDLSYTGFGIGGGYRKYFDEDFEGFFGQGTAEIAFAKAADISGTAFGFTGLAGYKWVFSKGFTTEAGIGAGYTSSNIEGYNAWGGFGLALRLALGYTW